MSFKDLGLAEPIMKALDAAGYVQPTPIQAQAIPPVLAGSDLLGIAQTGTGKTAAFALPTLSRLLANRKPALRKGCRVLVLSPTRELASQIAESFRTYGKGAGISAAVVFGGVGFGPQVKALSRGVDVLVATPGRLLDHVTERTVDLSGTEVFVLDEADQMLDLGFVKPIRRIVSELGARRQNLFFSATMPKEIAGLADELLKQPVRVAVTPVATTAERVAQSVIQIEASKKRALLVELFSDAEMQRTLVFTRTKRGADRVAEHLSTAGVAAAAIHGNKSQRQREAALADFKAGRMRVLVATDIASRGIDIDAVSHVVNYELPEVPEAYVHRIGRTARNGASGRAISLCDGSETHLLRAIERLTRQAIPSTDRRGDASLVATAVSREAGARAPRREDRDRGGRDRRDDRRSEGRSFEGRGAGRGASRGGDFRSFDDRRGDDRRSPPRDGAEGRPSAGERTDGERYRDRGNDRGPDRGPDRSPDRTGTGEARPWSPMRDTGPRDFAARDGATRDTSARGEDRRPHREEGSRDRNGRGSRDGGPVRFGEAGERAPAFMSRDRDSRGGQRAPHGDGARRGEGRPAPRSGADDRSGPRPAPRSGARNGERRGPPRAKRAGS